MHISKYWFNISISHKYHWYRINLRDIITWMKLICVFGAGYWLFFNHGESDAKTRSALQKPPGGTTGKRLIMSGLREETTGNCFRVILEGEGYWHMWKTYVKGTQWINTSQLNCVRSSLTWGCSHGAPRVTVTTDLAVPNLSTSHGPWVLFPL